MGVTCSICKSNFLDEKQLKKHHKKCHECSYCGKVFKTLRSKKGHVRDMHIGNKRDEEPSFADRAIEAQIDHAMGEYNSDYEWLCDP